VVNDAIDAGACHGGIGEDLVPFPERLVGRDQHGPAFVTRADELEEGAGLGLILGDVCENIEDEQIELVAFCQGILENEISTGLLQLLDEIGGAREQKLVSALDERESDRRSEVAFAGSYRVSLSHVFRPILPPGASGILSTGQNSRSLAPSHPCSPGGLRCAGIPL
jgi:hypothetical protein